MSSSPSMGTQNQHATLCWLNSKSLLRRIHCFVISLPFQHLKLHGCGHWLTRGYKPSTYSCFPPLMFRFQLLRHSLFFFLKLYKIFVIVSLLSFSFNFQRSVAMKLQRNFLMIPLVVVIIIEVITIKLYFLWFSVLTGSINFARTHAQTLISKRFLLIILVLLTMELVLLRLLIVR